MGSSKLQSVLATRFFDVVKVWELNRGHEMSLETSLDIHYER